MQDVAVLSPMFLAEAAFPYLSKSKNAHGGSVVVVGSVSGKQTRCLCFLSTISYRVIHLLYRKPHDGTRVHHCNLKCLNNVNSHYDQLCTPSQRSLAQHSTT
jgi:hypothetical protein